MLAWFHQVDFSTLGDKLRLNFAILGRRPCVANDRRLHTVCVV